MREQQDSILIKPSNFRDKRVGKGHGVTETELQGQDQG